MEYVVDLSDYKQEVVDKFMAELENKSDVKWADGENLSQYKIPLNREPILHYWNSKIYHRNKPDRGTVLSRSQFIEKMAELHPKKKQDIREYCKEHRVWAAKDRMPYCHGETDDWYEFTKKPNFVGSTWTRGDAEPDKLWSDMLLSYNDLTFPDVPWDKSLIAPDGSMPLMEEKKTVKHFEVGKWYIVKRDEIRGKGQIKGRYSAGLWVVYFPDWDSGHDGYGGEFTGKFPNHCWWCREDSLIPVDAPENKDDKPKRGDPVFVWDDDFSATVPVGVSYFHHIKRGKVYVFCDGEPGECYDEPYDHYRKFDASLVGVPRKDWDK